MFTGAAGVVSIILALLKLVNALVATAQQNKWMKAGADAEIAKTALAIAGKTAAGKAIMEKIDAMSEKEVDDGLHDLEPSVSKNVW